MLLAYTKITIGRGADRHRPARRPVPARAAVRLLPAGAARAVRRAGRRARAAPGDHHHGAGQRHGQHRRLRPSSTGCGRRPARRPRRSCGRTPRPGRSSAWRGSGTRWRRWTTRSPAEVQTRMRLHSRRLVERGTRWLLNNRPQPLQIAETIELFSEGVAAVWAQLPKLLVGDGPRVVPDDPRRAVRRRRPGGTGRPGRRASRRPSRRWTSSRWPTARARTRWRSPRSTTTWPTGCGITQLLDRIIELPRADRWQSMARAAIREDLFAAHAALTQDVLSRPGTRHAGEAVRGLGAEERGDPRPGPRHAGGDPGRRSPSTWPTCRWPCGPCARCCAATADRRAAPPVRRRSPRRRTCLRT